MIKKKPVQTITANHRNILELSNAQGYIFIEDIERLREKDNLTNPRKSINAMLKRMVKLKAIKKVQPGIYKTL